MHRQQLDALEAAVAAEREAGAALEADLRLMHQAHARQLAALDTEFRCGAYQKQYAAVVAQKAQLEAQLESLTPLVHTPHPASLSLGREATSWLEAGRVRCPVSGAGLRVSAAPVAVSVAARLGDVATWGRRCYTICHGPRTVPDVV